MKKVIFIVLISLLLLGILYPVKAQGVRKPKSETTAFYWSLGATLMPCLPSLIIRRGGAAPWGAIQVGLIASAIIVGPSAGHFYANQWGRGLKSAGLRLGLSALGSALVLWGFGEAHPWSGDGGGGTQAVLGIVFLVPAIGSVVYDIFNAPSSARKYNKLIEKRGNVYLMPKIDLKEEYYSLSVVYCF